MAPEQALGGTVTAKADQFSFCVAAWELFAGKRPFAGGTVAEVLSNKVAGQVEPADTDRWPEGLEPVLRRGLTVEPAGRYPSLEALLLVLDEIAKAKPQRRRRRTIQLAAVFGGAFSAGALTLVIASSGPSSSPSTAAPAAPPVAQAIQVEAIEVPAPASPAPTAAPIVVAEPAKSIEPAREPARVSRASSRKGRAKTASRAVASVQPAAQLAVPAVAETVAPPTPRTEVAPPAPDVSAIRASVDRELKAVDQARTARALLIADISGYGADREQALAAAARGDSAGAHEHVEAMRAKLGAVQIDSQFVNAKMMMLGARREKVQLTDAQDEEFKKRLHSATKADSPEAVNRHLTAVGNLLGMR